MFCGPGIGGTKVAVGLITGVGKLKLTVGDGVLVGGGVVVGTGVFTGVGGPGVGVSGRAVGSGTTVLDAVGVMVDVDVTVGMGANT